MDGGRWCEGEGGVGASGGMTSMRCLMCWERGVRGCGCAIFVAQRCNETRSSTIDMCVSE